MIPVALPKVGDLVLSDPRFDQTCLHRGLVAAINVNTGRITVQHVLDCCERTGLGLVVSDDCDPSYWRRVPAWPTFQPPPPKRRTAWERLNADDD